MNALAQLSVLFCIGFLSVTANAEWPAELESKRKEFVRIAQEREQVGYRYQDATGKSLTAEESVKRMDSRIVLPRLSERAPQISLYAKYEISSRTFKWELFEAEKGNSLASTDFKIPENFDQATWVVARAQVMEKLIKDLREKIQLQIAEEVHFKYFVQDLI